MGYRSDVAYVIKFDELAQRDAFITLMHAKNDAHINSALEEVEYRYSKDPSNTPATTSSTKCCLVITVETQMASVEGMAHQANFRLARTSANAATVQAVQWVEGKQFHGGSWA